LDAGHRAAYPDGYQHVNAGRRGHAYTHADGAYAHSYLDGYENSYPYTYGYLHAGRRAHGHTYADGGGDGRHVSTRHRRLHRRVGHVHQPICTDY